MSSFPVKQEQGYTFLEIMIVVVLIGLFSTVAAPAVESVVARQRLIAAVRTMTVHLREAQQLAISRERSVTVLFRRYNSLALPNSYTIRFSPSEIYATERLEDGIILAYTSFANQMLVFNTLGAANAGHVRLENSRGDRMYIIVDQVGRVRTSDVPPST